MKEHSKKCASSGRSVTLCDCDGYHTFTELYDHRIALWIALCRMTANVDWSEWGIKDPTVWRSKVHSDGTSYDGWFLLGINEEKGKQITYHIPLERWEETDFASTLERAPEFDGHSSDDVLKRLKNL
jgi:hypothetical protein